MATQRERMVTGRQYEPSDPDLLADRQRCRQVLRQFEDADGDDARMDILRGLFAHVGERTVVLAPLRCDYGWNITLGDAAFLNYGVVILDHAPVKIGDHALVGPGAQLLAGDHSQIPGRRRFGVQHAAAITLEADVWIGAAALILPGVTVGAGTIVGAGSVVTRDVPAGVVAAGNPCRVISSL